MVGKRWANEQSECEKPHKIRLLDVKVKDEARHGKAFAGLFEEVFRIIKYRKTSFI